MILSRFCNVLQYSDLNYYEQLIKNPSEIERAMIICIPQFRWLWFCNSFLSLDGDNFLIIDSWFLVMVSSVYFNDFDSPLVIFVQFCL